jgi:ketosteroid isomerase-like protein
MGARSAFKAEMEDAELIRQLAQRWNAGDLDGVVELYTEDAVIVSGPDWPEQVTWEGHKGIKASLIDFGAVWESAQVELGPLERHGDKLLGRGTWRTRGAASGAEGTMPFVILFSFRDGKIAVHEWFTDYDAALAAARST